MIVLITGNFPIYDKYGMPTEKVEFVASHGYDFKTGENVVFPQVHPCELGAVFDQGLLEWVIK
jgi:hypothetical protein